MPMVRRKGFRRGFDPLLLEAPGAVFCYCISDGMACKIGKSAANPVLRLAELQVANPRKLALVGWTLSITEAEAHRKLRPAKIRAEWFAICPLVLKLVGSWDWVDMKLWAALWRASRTVASPTSASSANFLSI
jgi:hypothetical protein